MDKTKAFKAALFCDAWYMRQEVIQSCLGVGPQNAISDDGS